MTESIKEQINQSRHDMAEIPKVKGINLTEARISQIEEGIAAILALRKSEIEDIEDLQFQVNSINQDLRLHKKYFSCEKEAQAFANEISKQLVRQQAETNDELRSHDLVLAEVQERSKSKLDSVWHDLELHKKHFSRELDWQDGVNEINKHSVRKQAETNDELRTQLLAIFARLDVLTNENIALRDSNRTLARRLRHQKEENHKTIKQLRNEFERHSDHFVVQTHRSDNKLANLAEMMTDGFDVHAKALLDLDEKTTNAFNSVSKNEEAVAQAIVSLRKQLERPFPESSIFDGLLG